MLRDILDDLEKAVKGKAYFSALALALTLPDICGKIEYHNLDDRGKYIKWFDEWIYQYLKIPTSKVDAFEKYDELAKFDGEVCYALRCAYLHAGNFELNGNGKKNIKIDRFELCVCEGEWQLGEAHGCSMSNGTVTEVHRRFNVENLINCFIFGTNDYIQKCSDKSDKYGNVNISKI